MAKVAIVGGAGHVGIPLALSFTHAGHDVLIHDVNRAALDILRSGVVPFREEGAAYLLKDALDSGRISFSEEPESLKGYENVILTIGTPVDEFLNPEHRPIKACLDGILPYISDDALLVIRSTVYPGTTDWVSRYVGGRLEVAFCPERTVQGNGIEEIRELRQLIGGCNPEAYCKADALFKTITKKTIRLEPIEAELAKLFANAYRYIEFATTNKFYMMAEDCGADYGKILSAMKTEYARCNIPGPGFSAGPCLFKDTMQLAALDGNGFGLGHEAMRINEGLVLWVVEKLKKVCDLKNSTVGILGMAFKAESDDSRASLSYKLKKILQREAKDVLTTDPYVKDTSMEYHNLQWVMEMSDVLVLATPHNEYRDIKTEKPLINVWVNPPDKPSLPGKIVRVL